MNAFRGMTADTVGRVITSKLKNPVMDCLFIGFNCFCFGAFESHDSMKILVFVTACTQLYYFKGRAAGFLFETVRDMGKNAS